MKVYLKGARAAFTQGLFEAKQVQGQGEAKFSMASIIEPTTLAYFGDVNPDSKTGRAQGLKWGNPRDELSKAVIAVGEEKWKNEAMKVLTELKAADRLPLHDGDSKAGYQGYAGNLFVNASNKIKPMTRDGRTGAQLEAKDGVIYSGAYVDVTLDIWAQANQFGKRVNASLVAVSFARDGERLAGGVAASEEDYAEIPEQAAQKAVATGKGAASLF